MQHGPTVGTVIGVGPMLEQPLHTSYMAFVDREVQGGGMNVAIGGIQDCPCRRHPLQRGQIAVQGSHMQRVSAHNIEPHN